MSSNEKFVLSNSLRRSQKAALETTRSTSEFLRQQMAKPLLLLMPLLVICCGCQHLSRFSYTERQMGVDFRIVTYAKNKSDADAAAQAAFKRIETLNAIFSDYDAESELRQICQRSRVGQPQTISKELFELLTEAQVLNKETAGAFDVSVGPLILLWRQARGRNALPTKEKINLAKSRIGPDTWSLNAAAGTFTSHVGGIRLDTGAIAKGYAADEALRLLKEAGLRHSLVDGGGDVALGAPPPGKRHWTVQIQGGSGNAELRLSNCAVATSGDTEQFIEIDGKRYSHIVDPQTGIGMTNRALVTTIAQSAALADAAASAVTILGARQGLKWADSRKVSVRFEPLETAQQRVYRTNHFPKEFATSAP